MRAWTIILQTAAAAAAGVVNATRLFDDGYNVSLGVRGEGTVVLDDFIGPGDTNIYEVGCVCTVCLFIIRNLETMHD